MHDATVISVLYRNDRIDLDWVPDDAPVVLVHNDRHLDPDTVRHPNVRHVHNDRNIGFGAAVNRGAAHAATGRLILCNPDTHLRPPHWDALAGGGPDELRTVPLVDGDGRPTSVVNPYPSPLGHLATALRLGRYAPRGGRARRLASRLGRGWIAENARSFAVTSGCWPLAERWLSGAVLSVDRGRFLSVGGFDESYFLYFEDVDLCQRLARRHPASTAAVMATDAGVHAVSHSSRGEARRATDVHHTRSALRYARVQDPDVAWRLVTVPLRARRWWVERRS